MPESPSAPSFAPTSLLDTPLLSRPLTTCHSPLPLPEDSLGCVVVLPQRRPPIQYSCAPPQRPQSADGGMLRITAVRESAGRASPRPGAEHRRHPLRRYRRGGLPFRQISAWSRSRAERPL